MRVLQVPVLALDGQYGHLLADEQPEAVVAHIVAFAERHGRPTDPT